MGQSWEWHTVNDTKKLIPVKHYGATVDLFDSLKVHVHTQQVFYMYMHEYRRYLVMTLSKKK